MSITDTFQPRDPPPATGAMMSDGNEHDEDEGFNSPLILTVIWVLLLIVFLFLPTCSTKRKRRIWRRRWHERRWNVQVEEEPLEDWFVVALARYREALQREAEANRRNDRRANDAAAAGGGSIAADILWREREEAILRAALKDHLLCGFTKTLTKADFVEVVPEYPRSPQNAEEGVSSGVAPSSDADIEVGVPATYNSQQQQQDNDDEEILIHKSDSLLEGAYRVQLPLPGAVGRDECGGSMPSGSADCAEEEEKNTETTFADEGEASCRDVPNSCAICMDPFYFEDRICWSSNHVCPHAFHEKCIVNWLLVLGRRRRVRMQRSVQSSEGQENEEEVDLTDYPMLCPCCRQEFVSKPSQANQQLDIEQQQGDENSTM